MKKLIQKIFGNMEPKYQQYIAAAVLGTLVAIAMFLIIWRITSHPAINKEKTSEQKAAQEPKKIETAISRTDPQEMWRYKMQEEREKILNDIEDIKNTLSDALEEKQKPRRDQELEELRNEISTLRELVLNKPETISQTINNNDPFKDQNVVIDKMTITLEEDKTDKVRNIEDTIPAGAFAKAVILGGVDASTSLSSQSDPRPILIRLVDMGTLPRRFKSDLQDCHIVASSYGELSSERVYARLEKLTCIERNTGEIVETQVAGYVAGEDGRVGVRGIVVEKSDRYLKNSIVGGVLQGVAGILTPQQPTVISPFSGTSITQRESNQEKFEKGFGTGVSSSMDRLSKYYIERAEKLQPVIQVAAGRTVDVVFTEGTEIGTEQVKKKLEERRIKKQEIESTGE
jgi:conjugal transfer pilus assembly protein TraB